MSKSTLVFIPNTLEYHKVGYLRGSYRRFDDVTAYYITCDEVTKTSQNCIGIIGMKEKCRIDKDIRIFIDIVNKSLILDKKDCEHHSVAQIIYDYKAFLNSNIITEDCVTYGKHFRFLAEEIQKNSCSNSENGRNSTMKSVLLIVLCIISFLLTFLMKVKAVISVSSTFLHFQDAIITAKWFIDILLFEKKFTPKLGNILIAKVIDLLLGIVVLNWFLTHEDEILRLIQHSTEDLISNLKGLLLYLMGSPIGLKLNYAFNKSLGQFFFYHISLWRIFLLGLQPLFTTYYRFLVLPGALGFSFQISMISDMISIATFHVYCIYVYAARLFNLQLRGLLSLWRLFIGRKYNPLRNRVDSCQYSQNQLFIGTLGFTVLLFLLPTTTLYYTVFSVFRLVILLINGILLKLRYLLNIIPVYVIILWIFNSSSIAGTLHLDCNSFDENGMMKIQAKLKKLPFTCCIKKFVPNKIFPMTCKSSGNPLYNMITGSIM